MQKELINYLASFLTHSRYSLFNEVLNNRTRYLTVVLEDIFQTQNASAVIRTCDCFGIQDVHIIENRNIFNVNLEVTRGSTNWLNLQKYNEDSDNTLHALNTLKKQGYQIVATSPHSSDVSLNDFDICSGKIALVFGNEKRGVSDVVKKNADRFLKIPMYGFTESFNISVSAAIILHHLTLEMRKHKIDWMLSDNEKDELILKWLRSTLKSGDLLAENFLKSGKI
jgi:tRNA (guanosine-2'-O-)-methyltransferase